MAGLIDAGLRTGVMRFPVKVEIVVDSKTTWSAAWYEKFPRSHGGPAGLHEAVPFERFGISPSAAGADTFARGTEGSNPSCSSGESCTNLR